MLFLLDTNVCIDIIRNKPGRVREKIRQFDPSDLAISIITVCELEYGASKSTDPDRNRHALTKFLTPFEICPFSEHAASHYGDIRAHLESIGNPIGAMDLLIAAHARSLSTTLVTNNLTEFTRVPGLRVENWATPQ